MKLNKSFCTALLAASCVFVGCGDDSSSGGNYVSCDVTKNGNSVTMNMSFMGGSVREVVEIKDEEIYIWFDETAPSAEIAKEECFEMQDDEDAFDVKCNGRNISYYEVEPAYGVSLNQIAQQLEGQCEETKAMYAYADDSDWDDDDDDDDWDDDDYKKSSSSTKSPITSSNSQISGVSSEFICDVEESATSVIMSLNIPNYSSYKETGTLSGRKIYFVQEYVYLDKSEAQAACEEYKEDAESWYDGSVDVSCAGNRVTRTDYSETDDVAGYAANMRENCKDIRSMYESGAIRVENGKLVVEDDEDDWDDDDWDDEDDYNWDDDWEWEE